jgi:hypothetical protein
VTDIETRLREGLRAEAARVQPHLLRELRVPARRRRRGAPRRGPRMLRWLAPLAAALAVVAVISAVRLTVDARPRAPRPVADMSPAVTAAPAAPMPQYYVSANVHTQDRAWINDSATGQVIAKVGVPGQLPIAITAAADDRTFIIVFQDLYRGQFVTFTRLTLGADGHPASFRKLPLKLPASTALQGAADVADVALSPDGQTLALSLTIEVSTAALKANPKADQNVKSEIELVSLRTGATRTWAAAPGDFIEDLSWARGSQTLAFLAAAQHSTPNDNASQVRVLDVSRPPGGLLTSSSRVPLRTAGGLVQSMLVTDNGSRVVAFTRLPPAKGVRKGRGTLILAEYSASTGRQLQVLSRLLTRNGFPADGVVNSADPSGQHLLVNTLRADGTYTVLVPPTPKVTTVTPLPGSSGSPRTFTQQPQASQQLRVATFFGRLDNGRATSLPNPGEQDPTEFGAW